MKLPSPGSKFRASKIIISVGSERMSIPEVEILIENQVVYVFGRGDEDLLAITHITNCVIMPWKETPNSRQ